MEQEKTQESVDLRSIVRGAIQEFVTVQQEKAEPAYKAELVEERRRREQLENRVNELVEENRRSRMMADEMERASTIRAELQRMGVAKIDLAFKAVKDDVRRSEDGQFIAKNGALDVSLREYLTHFVSENPELLPARIAGGSGASAGHKLPAAGASTFDLDKIRPGMSSEDLTKVREEISRIAGQALRGL